MDSGPLLQKWKGLTELNPSALYNSSSARLPLLAILVRSFSFPTWYCPRAIYSIGDMHASPLTSSVQYCRTPQFHKIVFYSHTDVSDYSSAIFSTHKQKHLHPPRPLYTMSGHVNFSRHFHEIVLIFHVVWKLSASTPSITL